MIIHYQITWANDLKEEGQLEVSTVFSSIVDLSLVPRIRQLQVSDSDIRSGVYPWYGYCGKITKVQTET